MEAMEYAEVARRAVVVLHRSRMNSKETERKIHLCLFIEACVNRRQGGAVLHPNMTVARRNAHDMARICRGSRLRHGNILHVGGIRIKFLWTTGRSLRQDCRKVIIDELHLDRIAMYARQIGTEQRLINAIEQAGKR